MEKSAEIAFAQRLASNEKTIRDRALKKLKKYISVRASKTGELALPQLQFRDLDVLFNVYLNSFLCLWFIINLTAWLCVFGLDFTDEDFRKLWKGLHYSMWMQDKPLLQVRWRVSSDFLGGGGCI